MESLMQSQTKFFKVICCGRCKEILDHKEVKSHEESSYESQNKLTRQELNNAILEGNISPLFTSPLSLCESCVDSPAYWDED